MAGGLTPKGNRQELALEIQRWFPGNTWTQSLAGADAMIAAIAAGAQTAPIALHPLISFVADLFVVPWTFAAGAFEVLTGGGGSNPPLPPPEPPPDPALYLMNYYSFEDNSGDDARCRLDLDLSATEPMFVTGGKKGKKKGKFDGTNSTTMYSTNTTGTGLELGGPRTFYMWVEWLESDNDDHIMSAVDEYYFSHNTTDGFYVIVYDDTDTPYKVSSGVVATTFNDYLISFTFDEDTGEFGIAINDGEFEYATLGSGTAQLPPSKRVDFGSNAGATAFFDGTIDEFSAWYGVQTDAHRAWIYNSGAGRTFEETAADLVGVCPPSAPSGLTATASGSDQIDLAWTDNSSVEDGFRIWQSPNGTSLWVEIDDIAADSVSYSVTGLDAETEYFFRVTAYDDAGDSLPSNVDSDTTDAAGDPAFADVELLLHANGTDTSTTFTDSSSTARTMTAAGNAQIDTAQSKWGGSSGYHNGNGNTSYITTPYVIADFQWWAEDYTIEAWVRAADWTNWSRLVTGFQVPALIGNMSPTTGTAYFGFGPVQAASSNPANVTFYYYNGAGNSVSSTGAPLALNTWNHIAMCYDLSANTIYVLANGNRVASATLSGTPQQSTGVTLTIGQFFNNNNAITGWWDDMRITKGTARYLGTTYTVPTAEFPDF